MSVCYWMIWSCCNPQATLLCVCEGFRGALLLKNEHGVNFTVQLIKSAFDKSKWTMCRYLTLPVQKSRWKMAIKDCKHSSIRPTCSHDLTLPRCVLMSEWTWHCDGWPSSACTSASEIMNTFINNEHWHYKANMLLCCLPPCYNPTPDVKLFMGLCRLQKAFMTSRVL